MPNSTIYKVDSLVECPFYCKESAREIKCNGLCGEHTVNVFHDKAEKSDYKYDFCRGLYPNCPLYCALELDAR